MTRATQLHRLHKGGSYFADAQYAGADKPSPRALAVALIEASTGFSFVCGPGAINVTDAEFSRAQEAEYDARRAFMAELGRWTALDAETLNRLIGVL